MLIFEVVILKPQVGLRLFGFSPEGDTSLPVCVGHRKTAKRFMQHIKPRGIQCRAIVPNGSTRRASGGVLRLFVLLAAVTSSSDRLGTIDLPKNPTV